ncbi:UNVERIFIED_ORG: DNA-binding winged helix-turn-helix (wHTH) protein [Pantoea agglomerans]
MAKFILEDKVVYDSASHSLFLLDMRSTQATLAIPASLCLLVLLQNKDETVSLEQLLSFAWGTRGMTVSNNAIYQNISILRKSLSSFGLSPDIIKTVPKRGFVVSSKSFSELTLCSETEGVKENSSTESSSVTSDVNSRHKKRTSTIMVRMAVLILPILCLISFFGVYSLTRYNKELDSGYIYPEFSELYQKSDCHIYRNKSADNDFFFNSFIETHGLKCDEEKWWYIFNYPPAPQTFILRCSSDLLSAGGKKGVICSSDYYY